MKKTVGVAEARARFGEILDLAEKGSPVVIERHGVRFRIVAEPAREARATGGPVFEYIDPAVLSGDWTWQPASTGVRFAPRRKRR